MKRVREVFLGVLSSAQRSLRFLFYNGLNKLILIFIFCSTLLSAQFKQDTSRNVNYLILPAVFRTPETGWGYGASTSLTCKTSHKNDSLTRTSSITALAVFTERGQNIQAVDANVFFSKEKYILYFDAAHSYFPENFWVLGLQTKDNWSERYVSDQFNFSAHLKKHLFKRVFLGLMYDYQNVFKLNYIKGGIFDTTSFSGKTPYVVSGGGFSASYDSRNKAFWPTKGFLLSTTYNSYEKNFGSSYNFSKWIVDVRFFQQLFFKHILAVQFYNYSTFGQSPMKNLARLGGADNLRGFYQGRLRDKNMASFILEYRAPVFWRFSLVAFGGIGNVYSEKNPLLNNEFRYSFGGGIRLNVMQKDYLNLRIDYGYYSKYNSGFYFTIGESF